MKRVIFVFDLENTLSDYSNRVKFISSNPANYDEFHKHFIEDQPRKNILNFASNMANHSQHLVWILTGMPEKYKTSAIYWMDNYCFRPDKLIMREENCKESSPVFKLRKLKEEHGKIKTPFGVSFVVFDDRQDVVDLLNSQTEIEINAIKV